MDVKLEVQTKDNKKLEVGTSKETKNNKINKPEQKRLIGIVRNAVIKFEKQYKCKLRDNLPTNFEYIKMLEITQVTKNGKMKEANNVQTHNKKEYKLLKTNTLSDYNNKVNAKYIRKSLVRDTLKNNTVHSNEEQEREQKRKFATRLCF